MIISSDPYSSIFVIKCTVRLAETSVTVDECVTDFHGVGCHASCGCCAYLELGNVPKFDVDTQNLVCIPSQHPNSFLPGWIAGDPGINDVFRVLFDGAIVCRRGNDELVDTMACANALL